MAAPVVLCAALTLAACGDMSRFQTAHYALATGVMALGYVLFKTISGDLQAALGYQQFFLWVLLCALPVFALLRWLPVKDEAPKADGA